MGYYIGQQQFKKLEFVLHFIPVTVFTCMSMLASEVVAQTRKPTNQPEASQHIPNQASVSVISNLISFANLNFIFFLSIIVRVLFSLLHGAIPGAPLLSVQACAMLLCLLFTNQPAMEKISKRIRLLRGSSEEPDQGTAITSRVNKDTNASSGVEISANINSETTGAEASSQGAHVTSFATTEQGVAPLSSICDVISKRELDIVTSSQRINHIMVAPAPANKTG